MLNLSLQIFGVIDADQYIGFPQQSEGAGNVEEVVMPYLSCVADFRKAVREVASKEKSATTLQLCDALRDDVLPLLGVRMEDVEGEYKPLILVERRLFF